jgi:hypothetical protein
MARENKIFNEFYDFIEKNTSINFKNKNPKLKLKFLET